MKTLATCSSPYLTIASVIVLLIWLVKVRAPLLDLAIVLPTLVLPPAVAASILLGPAFSHGHFEPLRRQQTVFTLTALLFLFALIAVA